MVKETTIGQKATNAINIEISKLDSGIRLPYEVDEAYFDGFSQTMVEFVTSLKNIKQPDLSIPENYFDGLANNIVAKLKEENVSEEKNDSILLNDSSNDILYSIPDGYFDKFSGSLVEELNSIENKDTGKVVSINKYKKWANIAVAASLLGIVITSAILFSTKSNNTENYLSYKSVDVNGSVNKLSDDDLVKYLNTDVEAASVDMTIIDDGAEPDVDQRVKSVSDFDLDQYLQESATTNVKKGI